MTTRPSYGDVTVTVLVPQRHMEKKDVLETSVVQLRG